MTGVSGFAARTGHERPEELTADRPAQVAQAWESLRQIRRITQAEEPELPAPWERNRPVQAVGLALEAMGVDFAGVDGQGTVVASGVRLSEERQGVVRAEWVSRRGERPADAGEARLGEAAEAAGRAGWDALLYRAGRSRYLLIEPGRAT
ncbi:hypothetical protein [Streptacidiphilus rugosus]|uniref:hypothetical protein n=1 Tax=Streptacidiphilus rugosus TaxID=405783 RepID=UPI00056831FE|nr:hypothetical protein [Streptacidiphilus rugosus]